MPDAGKQLDKNQLAENDEEMTRLVKPSPRQTSMVQKSQKTIEIPQVQHVDKVVDFPDDHVGQRVEDRPDSG